MRRWRTPRNDFWSLEEMPAKLWGDVLGRIRGRRQWIDARLLFEAERRDGGVVTFDPEMRSLAGRDWVAGVLMLAVTS